MLTVGRSLLALAEQHRLYGFRAHAAAIIGWALCQRGDLEEGIAMIAKAVAAFDSVPDVRGRSRASLRIAIAASKGVWSPTRTRSPA
jgi:hypothetical protein